MSTLFMGKPQFYLEEVDSTNAWALQEIAKGVVTEGTLYSAGIQTSGKGQRGNVWNSLAKQNLLLSYVVQPRFLLLQDQFKLTMAVSLAIRATLDTYLPGKVSVKWPNDIYVDDMKIAGVLIEASSERGRLATTVIGIGININQRFFNSSVNATSLLLETGVMHPLDAILNSLNVELEKWYISLRNSNARLTETYTQSLYKLNQWHAFSIGGKQTECKVMGVNKSGQLMLADKNEKVTAYHLFEVKMLV